MRLISFELAKQLALNGFNEYTPNAYAIKEGVDYSPLLNDCCFTTTIGKLVRDYEATVIDEDNLKEFIKAPSYAQVLAWMRTIKHIDVAIVRSDDITKTYHFEIIINGEYTNKIIQKVIPNRDYYEAEKDAIQYCIDNNLFNLIN